MNISDEYSTAIHEAAHAVMSILYERIPENVTILKQEDALGECKISPKFFHEDDPKEIVFDKLQKECVIRLAGVTAEKIILTADDKTCTLHGQQDFFIVGRLISIIIKPELLTNVFDAVSKQTFLFIQQPSIQQQIKVVADALVKHKTLSGGQIRDIINGLAS